jgi:hypothetical protein
MLQVPPSKWAGLKRLPLVGAGGSVAGGGSISGMERTPLEVIRSFAQILDADLAATLPAPAPLPRRRPVAAGGPAAGPTQATAVAATHTGYLPSVDDMLLHGDVPPPEPPPSQQQVCAAVRHAALAA